MTLAIRVLLGLAAGFLLGLALAGSASPAAAMTIGILAPVGTIFVNLIRMTVIPLVVSMLVAGVGGMTVSGGLGRTGVRAFLMSIGLLVTAAIGSLVIAMPVLALIRIDQAAALALRGPLAGASQAAIAPSGASTLAQWFVDLVPQNIVKAAADGAMLPVIVFAVMLGLALARDCSQREAVFASRTASPKRCSASSPGF
jgi:Na+/H+-dicarboxylate symporter